MLRSVVGTLVAPQVEKFVFQHALKTTPEELLRGATHAAELSEVELHELRELSARINSLSRRLAPDELNHADNATAAEFAGWKLDFVHRRLSAPGGDDVSLTTSEFALLPNPNPSGNFTKITQRLEVTIDFDEQDPRLRPGMMVEVKIPHRS